MFVHSGVGGGGEGLEIFTAVNFLTSWEAGWLILCPWELPDSSLKPCGDCIGWDCVMYFGVFFPEFKSRVL